MRLISLLTVAVLVLVGCGGGPEEKWASDDVVARAAYSPGGQPTITLYTMVSNDTGAGGHTAVMINGSQRVLYDPAGSWQHPLVPERNDLHFGFTEFMRKFYIDFHARTTYHVVVQELPVSLEQANLAIAAVQAQGAAPAAYCARYTSTALRKVPGLEGLNTTWFPVNLQEQFAEIPGVRTEKIFDDDPDYNKTMLEAGIVPIPADAFTAAN